MPTFAVEIHWYLIQKNISLHLQQRNHRHPHHPDNERVEIVFDSGKTYSTFTTKMSFHPHPHPRPHRHPRPYARPHLNRRSDRVKKSLKDAQAFKAKPTSRCK